MIALLLLLLAAPHAEVVVLVEEGSGPAGVIAARHLSEELSPAPAVETASRATDLPATLEKARSEWGSKYVIVLAPERGQISVIECEGGTALTRLIDAKVVRQSPYTLAVSAAELLELARRPRSDPNAPPMEPVVGSELSWSIGAGASVESSPGDAVLMLLPSIEAALIYRATAGGWWIAPEIKGRFFGSAVKNRSIGGETLRFEYTRDEVQLSLGAGLSRRSLDVGLAAGGGVSRTGVSAGEIVDRRFVPWLSLGGRLRQRFGAWGVALSADLVLSPQPVRYFARDQLALEEPAVRAQATLSVFWEGG